MITTLVEEGAERETLALLTEPLPLEGEGVRKKGKR
jgi:hypothetical protein